MEPKPIKYNKNDYLITSKGNKISKKITIKNLSNIQLQNKCIIKERSLLRGDLQTIILGKYNIFLEHITVRPSFKKSKGMIQFLPVKFGDYVYISPQTIICAAKIGSYVHIGQNCIIGHRVIIGDNVKILDDTIIAPDTVIPPYSIYGGKPATFQGQLPETTQFIIEQMCQNYYNNFVEDTDPQQKPQQSQQKLSQSSQPQQQPQQQQQQN